MRGYYDRYAEAKQDEEGGGEEEKLSNMPKQSVWETRERELNK